LAAEKQLVILLKWAMYFIPLPERTGSPGFSDEAFFRSRIANGFGAEYFQRNFSFQYGIEGCLPREIMRYLNIPNIF